MLLLCPKVEANITDLYRKRAIDHATNWTSNMFVMREEILQTATHNHTCCVDTNNIRSIRMKVHQIIFSLTLLVLEYCIRQATKSKSPSKYDLPLIFLLFGLYNGCWWFPKPHSTTFNHSGNVSWPQWGTVNFGTFLNNLRIHCWTGGRRMIM